MEVANDSFVGFDRSINVVIHEDLINNEDYIEDLIKGKNLIGDLVFPQASKSRSCSNSMILSTQMWK